MKSFDDLWNVIKNRCQHTVQEYSEIKHVFDLIQGCESYLEIGTAEGNSLYVLAHALKLGARIVCVDYGEAHTKPYLDVVMNKLNEDGYFPILCNGDSHNPSTLHSGLKTDYDVVLIDAGHSFDDAIADANDYGKYAKKYIVFHDVMLPEVERAFSMYVRQRTDCESYKFINSDSFGYGIMRVK